MRSMLAVLTVLVLGIGVAACGTSNSSSTAAATASSPPASASASATATSPGSSTSASAPTTASGGVSVAPRSALVTGGQRLVRQLAADAGALASGNSPREQQARQGLAQLKAGAQQLASTAAAELPKSSTTRKTLVAIGDTSASAAGRLQHVKLSSSARQALTQTQQDLNGVASDLGKARGASASISVPGAASIAGELAKLEVGLAKAGA